MSQKWSRSLFRSPCRRAVHAPTTASERYGAAHPISPNVDVAADAAILTADSDLRTTTECHGETTCSACRPPLQQRHTVQANQRCIIAGEIIVAIEPDIGRQVRAA